jgi:uncharacterized protein YjbI with pentapeptide repeats
MEYYDQVFSSSTELPANWINQEFEQCSFQKLDLSQAALTKSSFINCTFDDCTLTKVILKETKLYDVSFSGCKLLHVDFGQCNPFGFHVSFKDCQLDYTVFIDRKLRKAHFADCSLREAHFFKCDLVGTSFKNCNLELARFENNDLSQVDFSTSYNLKLDPEQNKIKKAKFSLYNLPGLLEKYELVIK